MIAPTRVAKVKYAVVARCSPIFLKKPDRMSSQPLLRNSLMAARLLAALTGDAQVPALLLSLLNRHPDRLGQRRMTPSHGVPDTCAGHTSRMDRDLPDPRRAPHHRVRRTASVNR